MSTNLAHALPAGSPREEQHPRHIEIVSTRSQRRARPRPIYAVVIVGGLFVLFIAQLLMSIVVSDGAYQISSLQAEQKELARTEQALSEQLNVLGSPQSLSAKAESLGMVQNATTPTFLDLATLKVIGHAHGAPGNSKGVGKSLVPNALLDPAKPKKSTPTAKAPAESTTPSVPERKAGDPMPSPTF